jgi:hypothetical protein
MKSVITTRSASRPTSFLGVEQRRKACLASSRYLANGVLALELGATADGAGLEGVASVLVDFSGERLTGLGVPDDLPSTESTGSTSWPCLFSFSADLLSFGLEEGRVALGVDLDNFFDGVVIFLDTPPVCAADFVDAIGVFPADLLVLRGLRVVLGFI